MAKNLETIIGVNNLLRQGNISNRIVQYKLFWPWIRNMNTELSMWGEFLSIVTTHSKMLLYHF